MFFNLVCIFFFFLQKAIYLGLLSGSTYTLFPSFKHLHASTDAPQHVGEHDVMDGPSAGCWLFTNNVTMIILIHACKNTTG